MKYIWEEEDIIPGRFVCKAPEYHDMTVNSWTPTAHVAKWTYKLGFINGGEGVNNKAVYVTLAMTDGMVGIGKTSKELASEFNRDQMIPMPDAWVQAVIAWYLKRNPIG